MGKEKNDPFAALFAEAVEAVEGIKQENKSSSDIELEDLDIEIEFIESDPPASSSITPNSNSSEMDDEDGIEIEIILEEPSPPLDSVLDEQELQDPTDLDINLDVALTEDSVNTEQDPTPVLQEGPTDLQNLEQRLEEIQAKYTKAKKVAQKRKHTIQEQEQKINALRMELFQNKGFVTRIRERSEHLQRKNDHYSNALGEANSEIEGLTKELELLQSAQKRQRQIRQKEQSDQKNYAHGPAVLKILPTLDNLELALFHAQANPETITEGVQLAVNQLKSTLKKLGIEQIVSDEGVAFNPDRHEAMMRIPHPTLKTNMIIEELQRGYLINGRLLRAARVSVSVYTPEEKEEASSDGLNKDAPNEELSNEVSETEIEQEINASENSEQSHSEQIEADSQSTNIENDDEPSS